MKITIVTLFEDIFKGFFENSIAKRSIEKGLIEVEFVNIRDYAQGSYKKCDDKPFAQSAGMLLKFDLLSRLLKDIKGVEKRVVFPSPAGVLFNQEIARDLSKEKELIFIAGHYEGIDQRVIDEYVDDEISIGDYVLSSGEVACLVIIDALNRLIDGVIAKKSLVEESFVDGLLEHPQYTRPFSFDNKEVPDYLLSGNHKEIKKKQREGRLRKTWRARPDLFIK